ncbi:NUDIX hydrolase [Treponema zuelzerae]|uniref:GDP-mannose pyrophosphatase n=1 Tax=Teretinema zuelzerae TaxID=156 RepID=A0AAE3EFK3_9SPIR|nr:NUDIX hydrolase [Teretinema zuelzerae]MBN2811606.1 NUDIX hydrolase [Spirochaetales bacterium]MCD1653915.1 NUDIX hydrolase [Teretinema zuelzerae]
MDLSWKPVSTAKAFSTRVFEVHEIESLSPDNQKGTYYTLHASDWVIVVPSLSIKGTEASFIMVEQWRHGTSARSIEFPGGVIDPGETPEQAAHRELAEETGYIARSMTHLASISPNPAIMDNYCHIFLAEDLQDTKERDLDEDEYVACTVMTESEVLKKMGKNPFNHGLMLAALFLYTQKKAEKE